MILSMLKMIGIVCVFFGCISLGMERIQRMKDRIWILREMERSLILFKGMAETYRLPMEWICEKISDQVRFPVSDFYKMLKIGLEQKEASNGEDIWIKCIKYMGKAFDKEDQMLFLHLGAFLGVQDLRMQNEVIDNCILNVRNRMNQLEKERPEKEHLYRVLSFSIGGFLILFFI